jgi:hypothetical protein
LNNKTYVTHSAKSSVLSFSFRSDIGSITNLQYRYKDDIYDRVWFPFQLNEMKRLSTNEDLLVQSSYKLPAIVMSTAATPLNTSAPLQLDWDADNVDDQYYLYMHFNEVEELAANETRAFNITLKDKLPFGPVMPRYGETYTVFSPTPLTGAKTHPPIINAFEVYKVKDFSQSETQQDDGKLAQNIYYFIPKYKTLFLYFLL